MSSIEHGVPRLPDRVSVCIVDAGGAVSSTLDEANKLLKLAPRDGGHDIVLAHGLLETDAHASWVDGLARELMLRGRAVARDTTGYQDDAATFGWIAWARKGMVSPKQTVTHMTNDTERVGARAKVWTPAGTTFDLMLQQFSTEAEARKNQAVWLSGKYWLGAHATDSPFLVLGRIALPAADAAETQHAEQAHLESEFAEYYKYPPSSENVAVLREYVAYLVLQKLKVSRDEHVTALQNSHLQTCEPSLIIDALVRLPGDSQQRAASARTMARMIGVISDIDNIRAGGSVLAGLRVVESPFTDGRPALAVEYIPHPAPASSR